MASVSVFWPDLKLSARLLRKYPGLTLVATFGIAVGIGISAGFFSAIYSHLYPHVPLDEGDRIVALENWDVARNNEDRRVLHDFVTWRDEMTSVADIGAFRTISASLQPGAGPAETIRIAEMTASGFHLARVGALIGRVLTADDERDAAPSVMVIGYDVWRSRFAGDRSIVGREVRLGDVVHTIVGVMPDRFAFPVNHQYWRPLRLRPSAFPRRTGPEIYVFGRLAPGATMSSAQAELGTIGRRAAAAFPQTNAQIEARVFTYTSSILDTQGIGLGNVVPGLAMLNVILVVIALNVAILVYARTAHRRVELAVRTALGASRRRIVTQLFVEAIALAAAPAAIGVALARYAIQIGTAIEQDGRFGGAAFWTDYSVQPATIVYVLVLIAFIAGIVGVLPALHATRRSVAGEIRHIRDGAGPRIGRMWGVLVVAQVATAVAALPAVVRLGLHEIRPSFTKPTYPIERFVVSGVAMEQSSDRLGRRLTELKQRLRAEPDISGVTFAAGLPAHDVTGPVEIEGRTLSAPVPTGIASFGIDTDYLSVYGARVVAGRGFEPRDAQDAANPVIVDQTFVHVFLNGTHAIGTRFRYAAPDQKAQPSPWFEIVGVAENFRRNPIAPELLPPTVLYPIAAEQISSASLRFRLTGTAAVSLQNGLSDRLRRTMTEVDPSLRLTGIRPSAIVDRQEQLAVRLVAQIVSLITVTGFLLSAAGIYALMSFAVAQRRREIGIRSALGASRYEVLRSIFSRVAIQVGLGVVIGVASAVAIELSANGFVMPTPSAIAIATVAALMTIVGIGAAFGPARRGLRIQPTEALRAE